MAARKPPAKKDAGKALDRKSMKAVKGGAFPKIAKTPPPGGPIPIPYPNT